MEQIYRISRISIDLFQAHQVLCERIRTPRSASAYGIEIGTSDDNSIEVAWANCIAKSAPRLVRSEGGIVTLEYAFFVDVHQETVYIGAIYMDTDGGFWRDAELTVNACHSSNIDALGKSIAKQMLESGAFSPLTYASGK